MSHFTATGTTATTVVYAGAAAGYVELAVEVAAFTNFEGATRYQITRRDESGELVESTIGGAFKTIAEAKGQIVAATARTVARRDAGLRGRTIVYDDDSRPTITEGW